MKLVEIKTGKKVKEGGIYWDFRHEERFVVTGWREPHKVSSSGKVFCKRWGVGKIEKYEQEFYPSVLGLKFR